MQCKQVFSFWTGYFRSLKIFYFKVHFNVQTVLYHLIKAYSVYSFNIYYHILSDLVHDVAEINSTNGLRHWSKQHSSRALGRMVGWSDSNWQPPCPIVSLEMAYLAADLELARQGIHHWLWFPEGGGSQDKRIEQQSQEVYRGGSQLGISRQIKWARKSLKH